MAGQKYNEAYEAYQQAVYRDGRNPTFWCSIGVLYFQINQYHDALDACSRAIRINPYISDVWFDLGSHYESCNNQTSDVIDAYARASELDPNNPVITQRLQLLRNAQATGGQLPAAPGPQDVHPTAYASALGLPVTMSDGPPLLMHGGAGPRPIFTRSDSRGPRQKVAHHRQSSLTTADESLITRRSRQWKWTVLLCARVTVPRRTKGVIAMARRVVDQPARAFSCITLSRNLSSIPRNRRILGISSMDVADHRLLPPPILRQRPSPQEGSYPGFGPGGGRPSAATQPPAVSQRSPCSYPSVPFDPIGAGSPPTEREPWDRRSERGNHAHGDSRSGAPLPPHSFSHSRGPPSPPHVHDRRSSPPWFAAGQSERST
ncbi:hypothetical protein BD410DRAFT_365540 [Rickenella mellea]|uniref:Uncharacterized protein n=1 Tax=Rickenella mellea TaxID=50990 RepID=A0A4Y7PH75_9AGAM|nr:hypothetical protein BD410DRAFT_365540 [Rickenella mellea]